MHEHLLFKYLCIVHLSLSTSINMLFLLYLSLQFLELLEMNFKLAIKSHICLRIMVYYFGGSNFVHCMVFVLNLGWLKVLSLLALIIQSVVSLGAQSVGLFVRLNPCIICLNLCLSVFIHAVTFD